MRTLVTAWIMVCLVGAPRAAHADEPTPWSVGVPKGKQTRALDLFKKGNGFFEEGKYTEALVEYEHALKLWDHPNIQFNLVVCLFNIRQPLQAWDHLEKALRFGEAPLGKKLFADAMTYKALLEAALAQLDVSSEQDDVQVMLDGTEVFTGKDRKVMHLLAGSHQLVATAEGFQTQSQALDLPAGKVTKQVIELEPEKVKVKVTKVRENYDRRWSWWIPWATAGTGVALALVGTAFYVSGRSEINAYDDALFKQFPAGVTQSQIPAGLEAQRQHAERQGSIGIGLWTAGGAVAIAAGVMAILNRPRIVEGKPAEAGKPEVSVAVLPSYVGFNVALSFR